MIVGLFQSVENSTSIVDGIVRVSDSSSLWEPEFSGDEQNEYDYFSHPSSAHKKAMNGLGNRVAEPSCAYFLRKQTHASDGRWKCAFFVCHLRPRCH